MKQAGQQGNGTWELRVSVDEQSPDRESVIPVLLAEGFESFLEEPGSVTAYTDQPAVPLETLALRIQEEHGWPCQVTFLPERNWNEEWERAYEDVRIGNRLRIRAPFHEPLTGFDREIVIEPKMSFGTAHHPTTRLMLELLLETRTEGIKVLDMGTGTGVLAILARMQGATLVVAVDNDHWSFENAQENFERNACQDIRLIHGDASVLRGMEFDLILANINRNVLLSDLPVYSECVQPGGELFLSGFYQADLELLRKAAASHGLTLKHHRTLDGWVAATFEMEKMN